MFDKLTSGLDFHSKALVLRAERQQVLASNMANADTPGYVARDFNFKDALSQQTQTSSSELSRAGKGLSPATGSTMTNQRHLPLSGPIAERIATAGFRRSGFPSSTPASDITQTMRIVGAFDFAPVERALSRLSVTTLVAFADDDRPHVPVGLELGEDLEQGEVHLVVEGVLLVRVVVGDDGDRAVVAELHPWVGHRSPSVPGGGPVEPTP